MQVCHAVLCGDIEKESLENDPVYINFEIRGLDDKKHENVDEKIVRIGGSYAKSVYEMKKPASAVRRDLLKRKAAIFRKPYGRVWKIPHKEKEKLSNCPYTALAYLKASTKYMDTIQCQCQVE